MCRAQEDKEYHWLQTIKLDPKAADAHSNLGVVYGMRGEYDKSLKARVSGTLVWWHLNSGM